MANNARNKICNLQDKTGGPRQQMVFKMVYIFFGASSNLSFLCIKYKNGFLEKPQNLQHTRAKKSEMAQNAKQSICIFSPPPKLSMR